MNTAVYPSYRLDANGPDETGFSMIIQVENGAAGPIVGMTQDSLLDAIRALFDNQPGVDTLLAYSDINVTSY